MGVYFEVKNEKELSLPEVKALLKNVKKTELNVEQKNAIDNISEFSRLTDKNALELFGALEALGMRKLTSTLIVQIINLMPSDEEDLKVILMQSKITFKNEELTKILEVVKGYANK